MMKVYHLNGKTAVGTRGRVSTMDTRKRGIVVH